MQKLSVSLGEIAGWKKYNSYRIPVHVAVWGLYLFAYAYIYSLFYEALPLQKSLIQFGITVWIDISAAYFLVYFLIPQYLLKKRYTAFLGLFFVSAIGFMLLQRLMLMLVTYRYIYPEYAANFTFFKFNYLYTFLNIFVMAAIFASVKLFEFWFINQKQNQELIHDKMESELKFLKSQIHPHFLFNTLNNLYALTLDKSENAPGVVVKLSDLLSYMLYDCNAAFVPLEKEVQLLNDYLDLEKIRYQNELKTDFDVNGRIAGKQIAPLLLLPFIENAFKHGLSKNLKNPWLNITLDIEDYALTFKVENNKPAVDQTDETGYTEGIGLKNVRRRLDLIYNNRHFLMVENKEGLFTIILKINLETESKKEQI